MKLKKVINRKDNPGEYKEILDGVRMAAAPVKASIGYGGTPTIVQKPFTPLITLDGKQIAAEVQLSKATHRLGADLNKMVSSKIDRIAHDSTSTGTAIWEALLSRGERRVEEEDINKNALVRGIRKTVAVAVEMLQKLAKPVKTDEQLRQIAYVAAHADTEIADQVYKAVKEVGTENPIVLDDSLPGQEVKVEIIEGLQFDYGYMHPMFMTDPRRGTADFKDAHILLLVDPIASADDMVKLLDAVMGYNWKPLVILAENISGDAFASMLYARHPQQPNQKPTPILPVKLPQWGGDRRYSVEDLALVTGATPIGKDFGLTLENFVPDQHLGSAKQVVSHPDKTIIAGGGGDKGAIEDKIAFLKEQLKDKNKTPRPIEERLAKLSGKVAKIIPGAKSDVAIREVAANIEDALGSVKTAKEHGYFPGGGTALYRVAHGIDLDTLGLTDQERFGAEVAISAMKEPARDNIRNVGLKTVDEILAEMKDKPFEFGYNGETNTIEDLTKAGVIDSAFGHITALEVATDFACRVLRGNHRIIEDEDADEKGTTDNPFPV